MRRLLALGLAALGCAATAPAATGPAPAFEAPLPASVERGAVVYRKACASCHGARGDGRGPGAAGLTPAPRDLTRGTYRYRSTPSGSLPQDADIARTVLEGAPGTAMPGWRGLLTTQEIVDVVAYVKTLAPRFARKQPKEPLEIPEPIPYTADSVARGAQVWVRAECGKCHGKRGRGDGWARADELRDDTGQVVHAADLTRGVYRSGRTRQDLYRVIRTGLDGSPMPSYADALTPEETYDLVNFVLSLERSSGVWDWLATSPTWYDACDRRVPR